MLNVSHGDLDPLSTSRSSLLFVFDAASSLANIFRVESRMTDVGRVNSCHFTRK